MVASPTDSITRKLFALIARCHQMLGDLPGALAVCSEGLSFDPSDAELLFRKAVVHRMAGQPAEAETTWRRILTLKRPEQFCSVDQGIYGHLTLRNLAEARRLWRAILEECPGDAEVTVKLAGELQPAGEDLSERLRPRSGPMKWEAKPALYGDSLR